MNFDPRSMSASSGSVQSKFLLCPENSARKVPDKMAGQSDSLSRFLRPVGECSKPTLACEFASKKCQTERQIAGEKLVMNECEVGSWCVLSGA